MCVVPASMQERTSSSRALVKTLHLINGEHYSGAERVQDLLAQCLPEQGFEVGFACVKPLHFDQRRTCQDAALYDARMKHRFDLTAVSQIAGIAKENNYQILHAHTPRTVMLARLVARKTGLPYVYHVHSPTARDSTRSLTNRVNQWIENWSIKKAARLITVSRSLAHHLHSLGVPAHRISVVPNGVSVVDDQAGRTQIECGGVMGTVALIRPRKGIEVLLKALAVLKERGTKIRLRVVGPFETAEYERDILKLATDLQVQSQIDWVGFTSDVIAELRQMDLFVLPSLFGEGLPMVVLEAMACRVPVIGTDVEGIPEALRDGIDGLIAKANDHHDLANKIAQAFNKGGDLIAMGLAAQQRQRECFSDKSMAAGVAAAYRLVEKEWIGR
jgi:glycosyltransferase involved in cell wall biosynthesis